MKWEDYEISAYTTEDVDGILRVLSFLWGTDEESNRNYFSWKHQRNPLLKKATGVVARYKGQVVAFDGLIPVEWRLGNNKFMLLNSGDSVIHPEHRGKGLWSAMGKPERQLYASEYKFWFSLTANYIASVISLKHGWKPIATRSYLRHLNLMALVRSKVLKTIQDTYDLGSFGDVEVSDTVRPADISRVAAVNPYSLNRLCLNKSPEFLEWRLSNPKAKFVYFYHLRESKVDAYVILSLSGLTAHVFDYGEEPGSLGLRKLFSFIVDRTRFMVISFLNATTPHELETFLHHEGFHAWDWVDRIRARESYNLPIFVAPIVENFTEGDWFLNGVDVRDRNNWQITEICFD